MQKSSILFYLHTCLNNEAIDYQTRFECLASMFSSAKRLEYFDYYLKSPIAFYYDKENNIHPYWELDSDFSFFRTIHEARFFLEQVELISNEKQLAMLEDAKKDYERTQKKRLRLKKFIKKYCFIANYYCYFITYTFSDDDLKLKDETRRKKVISFFKSFKGVYAFAMNKDFGEQHEREHYHCILSTTTKIDFSLYPTNIDFELCKTFVSDVEAVSKYVIKLANHGIKASTKHTKIYYFKNRC
jgi:hypothetical protein